MSTIIDALHAKDNLNFGKGCSEAEIGEAEKTLRVTFAKEYREYLLKFGIVAYDGHELTGISNTDRLNVVSSTLSEREINPSVPEDMYVIEKTNMDGVIIWQRETGEIFCSQLGKTPVQCFDSLTEFVTRL